MRCKLLMELLEKPEYEVLTVGEFVKTVKKCGLWVDDEVIEGMKEASDTPDFLKEDWTPKEVVHYTNKDKA